ncbi:MAG TPA: hypothetical protein VEI82_14835 [Myxococcota bacterium]|nr:hypothetical protein [Myxococcota bacterium]
MVRVRLLPILALAALACADPTAPAPVPVDHPPADLKSEALVRCLVDAPEGCSGCDQGQSCVYKQMKEYDCVYVVYGTKCAD